MSRSTSPITILIAEDDVDDRMLLKDAFEENKLGNELRFVENGEELLAYLRREGKFADTAELPYPGLVLLDLNMPRMDGREALKVIKNDPQSEMPAGRRTDDVQGGRRHRAHLQSGCQLLHHQAGDIQGTAAGGAGAERVLDRDRAAAADGGA